MGFRWLSSAPTCGLEELAQSHHPEGFYLVDEDNDICLRGTPLGCIYKPDLMDIFKSFPQGK